MKLAMEEERILLSHDQDFADAKRYPATKTPGIIIIKIHPPDEVMILRALNHLFNKLAVADINGKLILLLEEGFIAK